MSKHLFPLLASLILLVGCTHRDPQKQDVSIASLPPVVRDGFAKAYPQGAIQSVEQETYPDGTIHWEIKYRDITNTEFEVEFDNAGHAMEKH